MTPAQVVEMSVTVNNNSTVQDYVHPDHQTQHTFEITPGFKPLQLNNLIQRALWDPKLLSNNPCNFQNKQPLGVITFMELGVGVVILRVSLMYFGEV